MNSIELFSGGGGLALGIHRAGFHHLAVVEFNSDACRTLALNRSRQVATGIDWPIHEADVRSFDYTPYQSHEIALLAGGAPCQPFSLGGKHAGHIDERNMFPEVFRAVRELRPQAILLENVRGLIRESFFPYFQYILDQLALPRIERREHESWSEHHTRLKDEMKLGTHALDESYDVKWRHYNTADFGVPQERRRVFIVAFRRDLGAHWCFPEPTHSEDALLYAQYVAGDYWDAHNMPIRPVPDHLVSKVDRLSRSSRPFITRWHTVRDALRDLPEPVSDVSSIAFDNHLYIPGARTYPGHTGSPWDWPAKAIKAGDHGNPGGENMLRADDGSVRYFTVRELARLQTFPDEWHFATSWTESRRQLGNAVPVNMAEVLATLIREELHRLQLQQDRRLPQVEQLVLLDAAALSA